MTCLLVAVTEQDPFAPGLVGEAELPGPVLTAAAHVPGEHIVLLATPQQVRRAEQTRDRLAEHYPNTRVSIVAMHSPPPGALAQTLYEAVRKWRAALDSAERLGPLRIAVSRETPEVAVAWACLLSDGILDGQLVRVEPPRYVGDPGEGCTTIPCPIGTATPPPDRLVLREPGAPYTSAEPSAQPGSPLSAEQELARCVRQLGLCGEDPRFTETLRTAAAIAEHTVPVLIQGETGTGKGLVAQLIHALSRRPRDRFVAVNCGALPEKLTESTLFGHRKGAFTGATEDQEGKFEQADGGTLFLDEVGELTLELQPKLLKVLEDQVVEPLGSRKGRQVDVRIIAATNRNLEADVAEGLFREDLYHRLSFGVLHIPPLRERRRDIHHIALAIVDRLNRSLRTPKRLAPAALKRLEAQEWRGNVRALENTIGRSMLLAHTDVLDAEDLIVNEPSPQSDVLASLPTPYEGFSLEAYLAASRKQLILRALDLADGNQRAAAELLGITPQAVSKFLRTTGSA